MRPRRWPRSPSAWRTLRRSASSPQRRSLGRPGLLRAGPAQIVVGATDTLLALIKDSVLKLDQVRGVALAWADEILVADQTQALDTLMAEIPKDAARTVAAAASTPALEQLIERHARRARRVPATRTAEVKPVTGAVPERGFLQPRSCAPAVVGRAQSRERRHLRPER